jgi:hypothetical protein
MSSFFDMPRAFCAARAAAELSYCNHSGDESTGLQRLSFLICHNVVIILCGIFLQRLFARAGRNSNTV